jgi:hypothetical protein
VVLQQLGPEEVVLLLLRKEQKVSSQFDTCSFHDPLGDHLVVPVLSLPHLLVRVVLFVVGDAYESSPLLSSFVSHTHGLLQSDKRS